MKSAAAQGRGQYFAVDSSNSDTVIVAALEEIFGEIQAVNSVFVSTAMPFSVNVLSTNLNQIYIDVFRHDDTKAPRWFGNLKMHKLGFNSSTSTLFMANVDGDEAENPSTGFINSSVVSFWTVDGNPDFWDFRTIEENDETDSGLPDGNLVEKDGCSTATAHGF